MSVRLSNEHRFKIQWLKNRPEARLIWSLEKDIPDSLVCKIECWKDGFDLYMIQFWKDDLGFMVFKPEAKQYVS